jgi:hypothetical protein
MKNLDFNNLRIRGERKNGVYILEAEGKIDCYNAHLIREQLDNDGITRFKDLAPINPGIGKLIRYRIKQRLEKHIEEYPLPEEVIFNLRNAEITTPPLIIIHQTNELFLKPKSKAVIIPGKNTLDVIEHLRMQKYFEINSQYTFNSIP